MEGGNYIKEGLDSAKNTIVIFTPKDKDEAGTLARCLKIFSKHKVNLAHIESRSSARVPGYEFMVECSHGTGDFAKAIEQLRSSSEYFNIISRNYRENKSE